MKALFNKTIFQYKSGGIVTSPESVMTTTNMVTTPDSSVSLHSQLSNPDMDILSSCPASPLPPVPPLPQVKSLIIS